MRQVMSESLKVMSDRLMLCLITQVMSYSSELCLIAQVMSDRSKLCLLAQLSYRSKLCLLAQSCLIALASADRRQLFYRRKSDPGSLVRTLPTRAAWAVLWDRSHVHSNQTPISPWRQNTRSEDQRLHTPELQQPIANQASLTNQQTVPVPP